MHVTATSQSSPHLTQDSTFCYLHVPDEILPYIVQTVDEWEDPFLSLLPTNDNLSHATVVPLQGEETDEIPLPYHIQPPQPLYDDYTLPSDRHPSYPFGKAQAAFVHLRPGPGAKNVASHLSQADLQRFLVTPMQEQSLSQAQLQGKLNLGHWSDLGLEVC